MLFYGDKDVNGDDQYYFGMRSSDGNTVLRVVDNASTQGSQSGTVESDGEWHYISYVSESATRRIFYLDGDSIFLHTNNIPFISEVDRVSIGRIGDATPNYYWNGTIDEARMSSTNRSSDWIKLAYENQRSEDFLINQRPTLTITAGANGSVNDAGANVVTSNPMTITATPAAGYVFDSWTKPTNPGNLTIANSTASTTTVTVTGDGEVQANFVLAPDNCLRFVGATNTGGTYSGNPNQYVDIPSINFQSTGSYTVEAWVKWNSLQNNARPLLFRESDGGVTENGGADGFKIQSVGTGTTVRFALCEQSGTCTQLDKTSYITTGQWTHVAFSAVSGGKFIVYKNGLKLDSNIAAQAFSGDGATAFNRIASGSMVAGDESFDGWIDEVRIWTDIRSQTEIQADMFNLYGSYVANDNLLAQWDFNQASGSSLPDNVASYDGTLTDMADSDWETSFTKNSLTVNTGTGGDVSPSGATDIANSFAYTITATANPYYSFS
ncbi:MAG: hypothetical protein OCD01_20385, partial [Fibrobacterales bacterium]